MCKGIWTMEHVPDKLGVCMLSFFTAGYRLQMGVPYCKVQLKSLS